MKLHHTSITSRSEEIQMPTEKEYHELAAELPDNSSPHHVVAWALNRIARDRLVVTTGFGMEGCVLIDMFARHRQALEVTWLDTGVLFRETYELQQRLADRYPHIRFVNRGTSLSIAEQAERYGDRLWETDPDRCCDIRKVLPMQAVLANADVWVTAITRSQSSTRAATSLLSWDAETGVIKLAPLAAWNRAEVWAYVQQHSVPYNTLHERGYPSIGCVHCTRPVNGARITDYSRSGRWAGLEKTECGLHKVVRETESE
jgi:phosphoadenosine phosphosulfate reductase